MRSAGDRGLLRSSFILSESLINILPRKIGKIGKIGDLRRSFSRLTARSFFLSDLSGVLSCEFGDGPRQTVTPRFTRSISPALVILKTRMSAAFWFRSCAAMRGSSREILEVAILTPCRAPPRPGSFFVSVRPRQRANDSLGLMGQLKCTSIDGRKQVCRLFLDCFTVCFVRLFYLPRF